MTTHAPYGPDTEAPQQYPQHPPSTAYPTAPPWAPPPAAPDEAAPYEVPYAPHGQLIVPFPEEMLNASRSKPPAWWPVIGWTFFFGIFGVVSAARRAAIARRGRNSPAPYWVAWGATAAVLTLTGAVVAAVGVPALQQYREETVTRAVQTNLIRDGELQTAGLTATAANCRPIGSRGADGMRTYECLVQLEDGRSGSMTVTAGTDGAWSAVR
jgi:hypothetical protein